VRRGLVPERADGEDALRPVAAAVRLLALPPAGVLLAAALSDRDI
jgi:hypothetical protein